MARGILSGVIWGSVFSFVLLWLFSQLGGMSSLLTTPTQVAIVEPVPLQAVPEPLETVPTSASETVAQEASASPQASFAHQSTALSDAALEIAPVADTQPAARPITGGDASAPAELLVSQAQTAQSATGTTPVASPQTMAPQQPIYDGAPDEAVAASTPPAPLVIPLPATTDVMSEAPVLAETSEQIQLLEDPSALGGGFEVSVVEPEIVATTPEGIEALPDADGSTQEAQHAASDVPDAAPSIADIVPDLLGEGPEIGSDGPEISANVVDENLTIADAPAAALEVAALETEAPVPTPQAPAALVVAELETPKPTNKVDVSPAAEGAIEPAPSVDETPLPTTEQAVVTTKPKVGFAGLAKNVKTNRLARIDNSVEIEAASEPETPEEDVPTDSAIPQEIPAITLYSASFENPEQRPMMAIVLIDDGGPSGETLPFPVSYVIDPNRDDAKSKMAAIRARGNEVLALAPLPSGATPSDVEISFTNYQSIMPEVVGFMDTRDAGFQSGRPVAAQVTEFMAANGLGFVTYNRGLNSAIQVASKLNVPARLVFREFDNDGQDGATIKRFLDQAAFKARQQSGVILVGHNRPETVKALLEWGLGNRAQTVALAPVSVALLAE